MEKIHSDPNKITKDWENAKKTHMGNYGYLNIATNHPEIWHSGAPKFDIIKNTICMEKVLLQTKHWIMFY